MATMVSRTKPARLAAVLAAAALVAACGGGSGGGGSAAGTSTTEGVLTDESTTTAAPNGEPTTTAAGSGVGSGPSTTAATGGAGPGGTTATPGAPGQAVGARPGTYTYSVKGSARGGTPPTTRNLDTTSTIEVDPPVGNDQRQSQSSQQGGFELLLRYGPSEVSLVEMRTTGQGAREFKPDRPVTALPLPPSEGRTWTWQLRSTDGSTTIDADFRITGTERLTIGGVPVDTVKVDYTMVTRTTVQGAPVTVTLTGTRWQSVERSLVVQDHAKGDFGGLYSSDTVSSLRSLDPS